MIKTYIYICVPNMCIKILDGIQWEKCCLESTIKIYRTHPEYLLCERFIKFREIHKEIQFVYW